MSRYLILLPAPEAEWDALPPEVHEKGRASHGTFQSELSAGGHSLMVVSPLEPSAEATSMRPDGQGGALVTDGPFTESKEWIAGFDILECDDLDEAIAIASRHPQANGGKLELRPFWTPED